MAPVATHQVISLQWIHPNFHRCYVADSGAQLQVRGNEHVVGSLLHDSKRGGVHWYLEPRSNSTFSVDEGRSRGRRDLLA